MCLGLSEHVIKSSNVINQIDWFDTMNMNMNRSRIVRNRAKYITFPVTIAWTNLGKLQANENLSMQCIKGSIGTTFLAGLVWVMSCQNLGQSTNKIQRMSKIIRLVQNVKDTLGQPSDIVSASLRFQLTSLLSNNYSARLQTSHISKPHRRPSHTMLAIFSLFPKLRAQCKSPEH